MKADAYGHGAADVGRIALEEGARALCVSTPGEGLALRAALPEARILVIGPYAEQDVRAIRDARLELAVSKPPFPDGIPLHVKLDTGMGRYGFRDVPELPAGAVGLMSHLATAAEDPAFARAQIERFREAVAAHPGLEAHVANSAAAIALPESRFSAARCGVALYGLSPFGGDPADDGLRPGPLVAERARPGEAARAGREHGLRAPLRRRRSRPGSGSCRSATRTASGAI